MNKWDFSLIYKDENGYQNDFEFVKNSLNEYDKFIGTLNNLSSIKEYLMLDEKVTAKLVHLYVYASMKYDLNQKDIESQKMFGNSMNLFMEYVSKASFASSEFVENKLEDLLRYTEQDEFLKDYDYYFKRLFVTKDNILDAKSELIMSNYQNALQNYNSLYDYLATADNKESEVVLSDGSKVTVNQANFRSYLETLTNQDDRRKVFEAIFKFYGDHKNTFAGIYNGIISGAIAEVKNRNYKDILESFLKVNNIPTSVYTTLINTCKENTDVIKRYYKIRKDNFKLDKVHTYDRFLKFATSDEKFSFERSKKLFLESVATIGGDFEKKAKWVTSEGRIDVYPSDGKRTGAYSNSIYECGPFILLNHSDTLDSAFTLAHESGHSTHTAFANEAQPSVKADYPIFIAEIASTFNEQLFLDYLMKQDINRDSKLELLQSAIDGLLATFFRQALFADFEYQAFTKKANGETITYETLSNIMKDLYKEYYDIDLNDEPYKEFVWAYIPHFYHTPFYVYQYATSFAASLLMYEKVKNHEDGAFEQYINLLKAGGSDFPVDLVKRAGVDLTTKEPFLAVVKRMNDLLDMLEKTLKNL